MEKWIRFYENYLPDKDVATKFVEDLEIVTDTSLPRHRAKIMMHQAQRLVSLADDIVSIRQGRESLQLLFLLICAENTAKLFHNFEHEGQSKTYVRKFFYDLVTDSDRLVLEKSFTSHDHKPLKLQAAIDSLYRVRCDVVHEGQYWGFHFQSGNMPMLNINPDIIVRVTLTDFRAIIIRGCINAVRSYAAL